eukprot:m.458405 g.458405  ORF g.458405 m.458405 type:complete len:61 (+) comp56990_c0_seq13:646-828(+)
MHHALPISNGRVLEENQARIQEASTICVIGAGPAGVQLAADLCHHCSFTIGILLCFFQSM